MFSMINRLMSNSSWRGAPRKRSRRAHWGPETLEIRAVPAISLAGAWEINGQATSIAQTDTSLTFTNERGESSSGTFINNETQVQATQWGNLVGTLVGTDRIEWANGSVWTRSTTVVPDISGNYTFNGQATTVSQTGSVLLFTNERGDQSTGTFINNNTQVSATEWGITGSLEGNEIRWSNGTVWVKGSVSIDPPDVSGTWSINGEATFIAQSGVNVTLTNENGHSANGVFISETQIRADGWGGLIGTLSADANTITWANGTVWVRGDIEVPDLGGLWVFNGLQASISQNGNSLTFVNEFGATSTGSFLSSTQVRAETWGITGTVSADANTINWSNGAVWTRGDVDAFPDIAGTYDVEDDGSSLTASVQQNGAELTFVNERGESSPGFFNSDTEVTASAWFNLQGDLVGDQIFWGNGTVWTRIS